MGEEELDNLDSAAKMTVALVNRTVVAIKRLTSNKAEENIGFEVQPNGCCGRHTSDLKEKVVD